MKSYSKFLMFLSVLMMIGIFSYHVAEAQSIDGPSVGGTNACYTKLNNNTDKTSLACTGSNNKCAYKDGNGTKVKNCPL